MKKFFLTMAIAIFTISTITGCFGGNKQAQNSTQNQTTQNSNENKEEEIKPYGKTVTVKGKKMNTYTVGTGDKNIVWFPGLASVSPVLTYTNALKELSPNYKVTVIEPFGYGLSDVIGTDRTLNNIVEELHEAVKQVLGDEQYYIMAHSISGVYSMKYVNDYRKEVLGFIGIDTSTPDMYDGINLSIGDSDLNTEFSIPDISDVSDDINKQYQALAKKVIGNLDAKNEAKFTSHNLQEGKKYSFPKDMPVLFLLANQSVKDRLLVPTENKDWVKMHTDLVKDSDFSKTVTLDGDHLLYDKAYREIAREVKSFIDEIENKKA